MLSGKPTVKRHLGRPRRIWEDNMRMDLKEIGINARNLVSSAKDRDYLESPCDCVIEPPDYISHGVSYGLGFRGARNFKRTHALL